MLYCTADVTSTLRGKLSKGPVFAQWKFAILNNVKYSSIPSSPSNPFLPSFNQCRWPFSFSLGEGRGWGGGALQAAAGLAGSEECANTFWICSVSSSAAVRGFVSEAGAETLSSSDDVSQVALC